MNPVADGVSCPIGTRETSRGTLTTSTVLHTDVGPLALDNPIMSASGTFGAGWEGRSFSTLGRVGALVSKTITLRPRHGNPPPRIIETPAGMLNSIGLENRGADHFEAETLPRMKSLGTKIVLNIGGDSIEDFVALAERFSALGVDALEVNLSCPNVQGGKLLFSTDPRMTEQAIRRVVDVATVPVFAKLSPNVTSVVDIAKGAHAGGAHGLTLINTLIGMAVDWRRARPVLGKGIGGLSGPAIKPVALRMVYQCAQATGMPILGVGGVSSAEDVCEFLAAGASAVQVGTTNFVQPDMMVSLVDDLERLLREHGTTARELTGAVHRAAKVEGQGATR